MRSEHEIEYEYEAGDVTYNVEATVELSWSPPDGSVGECGMQSEVDDANFSIDGVEIVWSMALRDWDWGDKFPELDKAAFVADFDKRCDTVAQEAEAPDYEPDEPDYD